MKALKTRITDKDIQQGWSIVRGMVEAAAELPTKTARDKIVALKQIKHLVGMLMRRPLLKGSEKGAKRNLPADVAVIADIKKFGSLPKAVRAHMRDGRLSRYTTERSHIERIRALKKHKV